MEGLEESNGIVDHILKHILLAKNRLQRKRETVEDLQDPIYWIYLEER